MERRKTPRKDWVISKDDVGRAVLEWKVDPLSAKRLESDPCARTYDFLNRLHSAELTLEDDAPHRGGHGAAIHTIARSRITGKKRFPTNADRRVGGSSVNKKPPAFQTGVLLLRAWR